VPGFVFIRVHSWFFSQPKMAVGVYLLISYIFHMKRFGKMSVFLVGSLACSLAVQAQDKTSTDKASPDNPYAGIVARNVFGLVPPPPPPPPQEAPKDPPPKITPNGIMNMFGTLQVLFKVAPINKPGQPPGKEESYTMSQGDSQDDIEVVKIDEKAETITFNNHGTVQELPLAPPPALTGPAPGPGGPGGPAGSVGAPGGGARAPGFFPGRRMPPGMGMGAPGTNPNPQSNPTMGMGGPSGQGENAPLTPEAQVIMMEKQRADFINQNTPAAMILPPTPLTQQLLNDQVPQPPSPEPRR